MRNYRMLPLLAAALLAGCHRKRQPELVDVAKALPNIPLPPQPEPLMQETGTDAVQYVILSRSSPDSVVSYYRHVLSVEPFRLVNEQKAGRTTSFYAEQSGPSIWITVSPNGDVGSKVIIAGARDSSRAAKP